MREDGLIRTVTHLIDCHGWEFSWDARGLRLTHDAHTFVLGIPAVFLEYGMQLPSGATVLAVTGCRRRSAAP